MAGIKDHWWKVNPGDAGGKKQDIKDKEEELLAKEDDKQGGEEDRDGLEEASQEVIPGLLTN